MTNNPENGGPEDRGWFASSFGRLSTGAKMLLIVGLFLLPLGAIALLASLKSAADNELRRVEATEVRVEAKAQRLYWALSRSAITVRGASEAIAPIPDASLDCAATLRALARLQIIPGRYALIGNDGAVRCATPGFAPPAELVQDSATPSRVAISRDGERLQFATFDSRGQATGAGDFSRATLARLAGPPGVDENYDLVLAQRDRQMLLRDDFADGPFVRNVRATAPLAGGRLQVRMALARAPITFTEFLMVSMPLLMWLFAAVMGWLVVDRLLLRPLKKMQRAVAAYQPGDQELTMPRFSTPAREINELGGAFNRVTRTVARHEAELEAAVERQKRLVREVHHRVKNNLQVVASLLNLHARGAANEDVAAAYASIQRRVDALAVVHRNHYAELEENRGVALRSLISELAANLRATAPAAASNMAIRLDVEPFHANQDVAVSVAFLITEIVEYVMLCGANPVTISLTGDQPGIACLAIESDSLKAGVDCDPLLSERFERIVTGLSRQLRSAIDRDEEEGCYTLNVQIVGRAEF